MTTNSTDQVQTPEGASRTTRLSALELAARRGIGPLSEAGKEVWHGDSRPCVSCGELVRREDEVCSQCGQDLSPEMIAKMQAHAGPWYVHEHIRPFPGVTLERLIRQARRGILTRTTIVRGPTTHHQWRFAAETPGLAQYLGVCWKCQEPVTLEHAYCLACGAHLGTMPDQTRRPFGAAPPPPQAVSDLDQLSQALRSSPAQAAPSVERRGGIRIPAWLFVALMVILSVAAILVAVELRTHSQPPPPAASATPTAAVVPEVPPAPRDAQQPQDAAPTEPTGE